MNKCICGLKIVSFSGRENARDVMVLDAPDFEDVRNGFLMAGAVADVMRQELQVVGLDLLEFRVVSLWGHTKPKKKSECTVDDHASNLWTELVAKDRRSVLVMGNDVSKILFDAPLIDVCGLPLESEYIPKGVTITAAPAPLTLTYGMKGEMVLSLQKYRRYLDD